MDPKLVEELDLTKKATTSHLARLLEQGERESEEFKKSADVVIAISQLLEYVSKKPKKHTLHLSLIQGASRN